MNSIQNENPELNLASGFLHNTAENIFLTGKAGTGKTTFLQNLKKSCPKRMVVLAPTGVAAINAGGVTIHSFFQLPFGPWLPGGRVEPGGEFKKGLNARYHKFSREKLNIIRSIDLLVIDEISMVRADLLDGIDELLRRFRDHRKPFGGLQLLLIGDIQQLAPVVKNDEWELLKDFYENPFFFSSKALKESGFLTIELKRIYRQTDQDFIQLLNNIRHNLNVSDTIAKLNNRYIPGVQNSSDGGIILTTHNYQAKEINDERLNKLPGKLYSFSARIEGDFPEYSYPTDLTLQLKAGAQVMFVKNDSSPDKRYFNGKIGVIESFTDDYIVVRCKNDTESIRVTAEVWQNARYGLNKGTNEIVETVTGTFTQYPLKTAWAITIHKSQGLTFDKVIIDAANAFAHGQVYVALSRCRTLEGLTLSSPVSSRALITDSSVSHFTEKIAGSHPGENDLRNAMLTYEQTLLHELFDFSTLQSRINEFMYVIAENRADVLTTHLESLQNLQSKINDNIHDIERKFKTQLDSLLLQEGDIRKNTALQERITKAVPYFVEKIESVVIDFLNTGKSIEVDNEVLADTLADRLKKLSDVIGKKLATLQASKNGFILSSYLDARAKASIEKPEQKKQPRQSEQVANSNPDLYQTIRKWRNEKAESLDLPPYMILQNKTMVEISERVPASLMELKKINGIGKRKLSEFGDEILKIIEESGTIVNREPLPEIEPSVMVETPKTKVNTRQITLDMFQSGKTIAEIAKERNLTLSTIEGHLARYIETGQLSISLFLTEDKVAEISAYFSSAENWTLSAAKEYFGEKFSYGELRMVQAHLKADSEFVDVDLGV